MIFPTMHVIPFALVPAMAAVVVSLVPALAGQWRAGAIGFSPMRRLLCARRFPMIPVDGR